MINVCTGGKCACVLALVHSRESLYRVNIMVKKGKRNNDLYEMTTQGIAISFL